MSWQEISYLVGGLWMFLFGVSLFEDAIKNLATKSFRNLIKNATNTLFKSIGTGVSATAILQSSAVVSLMAVSFVGAGVLDFSHAIWIILWTNIWAPIADIVLGNLWLRFSLSSLALPLIGLSSLFLLIFSKSTKLKNIFKIFIGLWLLFLWLGYMRDSMLSLASSVDLLQYINLPLFIYFLLWLVLTILMQSSSATIVLVLTAASSGIIDYRMWIPLILWAFLWTTLTVVLWSLGWNYLKKQVAFSHVFFNLFSVILWFIFFPIIVVALQAITFNTIVWLSIFAIWFKILCVLIVTPFIWLFVRFLQKLFPEKKTILWLAIDNVSPNVIDASFLAIHNDSIFLIKKVFKYILNIWLIDEKEVLKKNGKKISLIDKEYCIDIEKLDQQYVFIKKIEQSLIGFSTNVKRNSLSWKDIDQMSSYFLIISNIVYAAKYMKDIRQNIENLQMNSDVWFQNRYKEFRGVLIELYKNISEVIDGKHDNELLQHIVVLLKKIHMVDQDFLNSFSQATVKTKSEQLALSDLLHINRSFYLSSVSLVSSLQDLFLSKDQKLILEELENINK